MSRSVVADAVGDVVDAVDEAVDVSPKAASHWQIWDGEVGLDVRAAEAKHLETSSHPQTGAKQNRGWKGPRLSLQSSLVTVEPDLTHFLAHCYYFSSTEFSLRRRVDGLSKRRPPSLAP